MSDLVTNSVGNIGGGFPIEVTTSELDFPFANLTTVFNEAMRFLTWTLSVAIDLTVYALIQIYRDWDSLMFMAAAGLSVYQLGHALALNSWEISGTSMIFLFIFTTLISRASTLSHYVAENEKYAGLNAKNEALINQLEGTLKTILIGFQGLKNHEAYAKMIPDVQSGLTGIQAQVGFILATVNNLKNNVDLAEKLKQEITESNSLVIKFNEQLNSLMKEMNVKTIDELKKEADRLETLLTRFETLGKKYDETHGKLEKTASELNLSVSDFKQSTSPRKTVTQDTFRRPGAGGAENNMEVEV